ncbi:MAG TPA: S8/S53 family peptidase [Ignavibacteria bacterium]
MVKNKFQFKKSLIIVTLVALSISLFGFKDNAEYKLIDGIILKRVSDGAMFEKGVVNLKFKTQLNGFTTEKFGISKLDNSFSKFNATKVKQLHPLRVNKFTVGDDILAMIFRVEYSSDINPIELSKIILEQNGDILDWIEPSIIYEPDFIPNDPSMSQQWHISKILSTQAWDICKGDTNLVIGIVDTGSDLDHPDLADNIHYNYADPPNGIDDDGNGYIDDYRGWDFVQNNNNPNILVVGGGDHGSHVSGCASQVTNNGVHGAGIGFKCKLLITKHWNDVSNTGLWYVESGVVYAYQNGAKVINCSYGSASYSSYSQTVCTNAWNAGSVICASAGNGDDNGIGQNWARYPASYDNVVSVAASNQSDIKSTFSNFHSTVDVIAPGESILSTVWNNSYASWAGTSMSSPITAGTVALIRSLHPTWTPAQTVQRLQLGVDSIYNLNPSYVGLLGSGRINAFKCLADSPILSLLSYAHNDSIYGNNDKVYDIDEVIPISVSVKNEWLAGANVSLRLTTDDPAVTIVTDSIYIGNIAQYNGVYNGTFANAFKVKANSVCSFDRTVTFKLAYSSSAYTRDGANTFAITFRQGFVTHTINNLFLSLTKDGAVGKKAEAYGNGLHILNGTANQLFEGGLLIGKSSTQVSDVCNRGNVAPYNVSDTDFTALSTYTLYTPGTISSQDGIGSFNDNGAGTDKIGVLVTPQSFAWNTIADQDYILLKYNVQNTNSTALNNIYIGLCIYFSPNGSIGGNISTLDTINKLGYTYNVSNPNIYLGCAMMSSQTLNFKAINATDIFNGFTTDEKWQALSSGISVPLLGPGANCFMISGGPVSIAPNATEEIGFAIVKGNDLNDLKAKTIIARNKYAATIGITPIGSSVPDKYDLSQNYPNPFNPTTRIKFALPKNEFVNIKIYDILGKEVASIINENLAAGFYEVEFNANNLASGMYFYKFETPAYKDIKKMMLIK